VVIEKLIMIESKVSFYYSSLKQLFSKKFISVILISIPSAIIADYFNIPLAWMLGPMIVTSIAALAGLKIVMPKIALSFNFRLSLVCILVTT
jgi:uncharacterized membrane protein AbrB (regulator of aidB expression)